MKQGWESKKLGDICTFKNGRAFKKTEWVQDGLPIIRIANLNNPKASFNFFDGEFDKSIFIEKGDLLFSWSGTIGSSFGPHIWNSNSGLLNQHIHKIGIKDDTLRDFLYYLFLWITSELEKLTNGAVGLVHVNKSTLVNYPVLLPSIDKQSEVVTKLDQCFEAIDKACANAAKNLENAKELFQSKLNEIFSQKGEGWVEKKLIDVCERIFAGGDKPEKVSKFKTSELNIPIFSNGEKNKGLYGYTDIARVDKPSVTISGRGTIGYSEIREEPFFPIVRLVTLIPNSEIININFLHYGIQNIDFINSGSSIPQLTVPMVKDYSISVTSLEEQKQLTSELDVLSKQTQSLESKYQQELNSLEELKKSILQKAFEGEL